MRTVASYRLTCNPPTADDTRNVFETALEERTRWLRRKGSVDGNRTPADLILRDGRIAQCEMESLEFDNSRLDACKITEPAEAGRFRTRIELSHDDAAVEVACELAVGGIPSKILPVRFDAKCPNVLHRIVESNSGWTAGGAPVSLHPRIYTGAPGGRDLCSLIWAESRHLPLVVISDHDGLLLHPELPSRLAWDLCGLAVVATIDGAASWEVTRGKGSEWSCYHGAIRVYWPMSPQIDASSEQHPLWTPQRLLHGVSGTPAAMTRFRKQLRGRIFGLSTFAHPDRSLGETIRERARDDQERARNNQLQRLRRRAEDGGDWKALAEEYEQDGRDAKWQLNKANAEIQDLRTQLENLQAALQFSPADAEDVSPETSAPPSTVNDAVDRARQQHAQHLVFGDDVDRGVRNLNQDAGPPYKILQNLDVLSEMTRKRLQGNLGTQPVSWLKEQGFPASGESETVRNSRSAMKARTWNDGRGGTRQFTLHLKPVEATSPDRCVRIYFDFDEEQKKTIVGWIGRHPK